ncbi:hypothetical protein KUTeg_018435 [Tegillarca granosa]|uniref:Maspardin n=1 Tax=Tegillarca granosa TaxID=220873 RepID=A0ABQ9EHV3_TEGGR|nr:hypothetical protein KUTeg_018435 [Tegillarca granosa]
MGDIANSREYQSFRSTVPQKKVVVDDDESKEWTLYDAGPKTIKCPLICFPPASGTADVFFRQLLALSGVGYRVIAVHIFGTSLGGFLAQKFAEFCHRSQRVASLILCNTFYDTSIFQQTNSATTFWMMPAIVLKKMVMGNFDKGLVDKDICDSIDFLVERVFDECALSFSVREEMYKCYPDAKRAHLKSGGNFPYLSRSDEVNLFIQIHMKAFDGGRYSAKEGIIFDVSEADPSVSSMS